jgi:hypothetical protein
MKTQTLEAQILDFLQSVRDAKELSKDHPNFTEAKEVEALFTGGVDFLRSIFPNPVIRRLASVLWETVGQKITPVTWGLPVKSLSFVVVGPKSAPQAMIAAPQTWAEMVGKDPIMQLGALVFVGSQSVDYAHEHFLSDQANVVSRAGAYESEFLNTVKSLIPTWEPGTYQASVLQNFPDGLASPKAQKITYPIRSLVHA